MVRPIEHHDVVAGESIKFQNPAMALAAIELIDSVIQIRSDINVVLDRLMDTVREIFNSSRAWLFHPCNPKLYHFDVTFESTLPEYPGAKALSQQVPMTDDMADYCRRALSASDNPEIDPAVGQPVTNDIAIRFNVKSMLFMALWPKSGEPWMFGLHQCDRDRIWTNDEIQLFQMIGRRISACLDNLLYVGQLRDSEEKHRRLFETLAQGVVYQAADGSITSANPAAERILGLSFEQMRGKMPINPRWKMIKEDGTEVPGKDHPAMIALRTGRPVGPVVRGVFHPDRKTYIWLSITVIPLYQLGETKPFQVYATFEDVTEIKRAEGELYKSEAMTKALLNGIPESAFLIESDGTIIAANTTVAQRLNCSMKELIGSKIFNRVSHEVAEFRRQFIDQAVRTGAPVQFEDVRSGRNIENRINPILDQHGNVTWLAIVGIDITDRKRSEKALRDNRDLLDATQRLAKVGGWVWDVPSQTMTWTDQTYRIHGFTPGEVESGSPEHVERSLSCYDPEDRPVIEAAFLRCAEEGVPYDLEFPFTTVDGRRRWVQTTAQPVCEGRRVVRVIGNIVDITERKEAEETLRQRLAYEQLLNEASTMAFVADDLSELYDRLLALVGKNLGVDRAYFFRHDEARDTMDNTHEWCAEGIRPQQDKLQGMPGSAFSWWLQTMRRNEIICYPDIEKIPDETTKEILRSQDIQSILVVPLFVNGQYYGFLGLDDCARRRDWQQEDVDIFLSLSRIVAMATERKQAEEALRENQDILNITGEMAKIGGWELYPETMKVTWTDETYRIHEVSQRIKPPLEDAINFWHPEDQPILRKAIQQALDNGIPYDLELRFITAKGKSLYARTKCNPVLRDGKVNKLQGFFQDITEHKRAEEALKKSEASLKEAQRLAEIGSWSLNIGTGELSMSDQMYSIIGLERTPDALDVAAHEKYYTPESWQRFRCAVETARETGKSYEIELEVVRDSGGNRHVVARGEVLKDEHGQAVALRGTLQDITERVTLQARLNQAEKMESVGRLAGGVAHDFNNMLGVILGHTEMALEQVVSTDPLRADLEEVQKAAQRSAHLTRQLLAFARKQTIAPRVIDLNETVKSMLKMLKRLIGEDIDLVWVPEDKNLWPVKMDPSQIDQVLANLCVNARDAITDVGKITIETAKARFDEAYCADHPGFVPGDFVLLAVSDDGCGMDKQTLANLFEPFFTTKDVDKGTGLGLATVYGIVKQNNGFINVYSETGRGTTVKIYLPRHSAKTDREMETHPPQTLVRGSETILLVEDEPSILRMTRMMLERIGYKVLAAGTPGEAIELAREHAGEIHLLMTDVVMPEMNGRDLARNLLSLYPNIKRLFMSGYTANVIAHHGVLDPGVQFIQKPFAKDKLATKVREALEES